MEAAAISHRSARRELTGDKAARIAEAMHACVATHGIAGSTFDRVAKQAGVSRGLLHYYFGTKERLLVEVVRIESGARGDLLEEAVADARDADGLLAGLVRSFEQVLGETGRSMVTFYELVTLGQRNREIAIELAELARSTRERLASALRAGAAAGRFQLRAAPDEVAGFLFALADGVAIRRLSEPELDIRSLMEQAVGAARALLA